MSEPRVTVVVRHSGRGTIRRALDSLRAQTCKTSRLVIDDGSPDETAAIVAPVSKCG